MPIDYSRDQPEFPVVPARIPIIPGRPDSEIDRSSFISMREWLEGGSMLEDLVKIQQVNFVSGFAEGNPENGYRLDACITGPPTQCLEKAHYLCSIIFEEPWVFTEIMFRQENPQNFFAWALVVTAWSKPKGA